MTVGGERLAALLAEHDPHNPLVAALSVHPAAGSVALTREHSAVGVTTTVGPGTADPVALSLAIDLPEVVLHSMTGGISEAAVPTRAFSTRARRILPRADVPGRNYLAALTRIDVGSDCGRSSGTDVPFFLLTGPDVAAGIWIAVAHSGSWNARLTKLPTRPAAHRLDVHVGSGPLSVAAGDAVALPAVWIGAFRGDGWAAIREHLAAVAPARTAPWVVFDTWFGDDASIDADRLCAHADVLAGAGFEAIVLDGGWYATPPDDPGQFATAGLGTWEPDPHRFPDGLEPVSAHVRELGLTFGVWFEPERAHPESTVAIEHPDWLRTTPTSSWGLVDLGHPGARRWVLDLVDAAVRRWSLGWIKWDMNHERPADYWAGDTAAELAHCRGLWWVLDELRSRHPGLVIEGCAAGGHRIDLELVRRCDTFWISDQTINPDSTRQIVRNAARLLPAQYRYLSVAPCADPGDDPPYPDEWFVSLLDGVFGVMDAPLAWTPELTERIAGHVTRYRSLRHLLAGERCELSDRPSPDRPLAGWEAWELSDPRTGEAALVALRVESPDARRTFTGAHEWTVELPRGGATVLHRSPDAAPGGAR